MYIAWIIVSRILLSRDPADLVHNANINVAVRTSQWPSESITVAHTFTELKFKRKYNYSTHHNEEFFLQVRRLQSPVSFRAGITVPYSRAVLSFSVVYFDFTCPFRAVLATASVLSLHRFPRCVPHRMHLVRSVGFIRVHRSQCHCRTEAIEPILLESWLFYHEISFGLQIFQASWSTILMHFVAECVMYTNLGLVHAGQS